ncbi:MAG: SDR family oxidoreductase [Prevotellaceae bacterium]|jgi:NAD(P)-dependent dehydrogenase (short-subunit alcohol dehydrogenase family)|nr:SDR family oxidoreductase [Prevotellaceae bacterium]
MNELFSIKDQVIIVTGGYGVLGSNVAKYLASQGAVSVIIGRTEEKGSAIAEEIKAGGGKAVFLRSDVLNVESLHECKDEIIRLFGRMDALVNVAGGNMPGATLTPDQTVFDMKLEDWDKVVDLNLNGTVYPSLIFGQAMSKQVKASIVNITSMAAYSSITRVLGYSVAKSGVSNFTQWMAMEMAIKFGDGIRVNAIAPGFFIGDQNRAVLMNPDGSLTDRSKKVIAKTPMGRFGDVTELNGAVQFLCSDAASFITGVVLPVDGGFLSFSGV